MRVLLVDSGRNGVAWFSSFARACGGAIAYADIEAVLAGEVDLAPYAHVFFALGPEAFASPRSAGTAKLLGLISWALGEGPGTVGVFVPRGFPARGLPGVDLGAAARFLAHPFGDHPARDAYDTTLLVPAREGDLRALEAIEMAAVLPRGAGRTVVGCVEVLSLERSFRLMPLDAALAARVQGAFHAEVARWLGGRRAAPVELPSAPVQAGLRKTGWMELTPFEEPGEAAERIVEMVARARLDALWLSLSPNRWWREGTRFFARRDAMLASIGHFTRMLRAPAPEVLVAFHPADNFTCPPFPARPALDAYHRVYEDVPAPLDDTLWDEEYVAPLAWLAREWASRAVVPLGGVVFDLELYLRKVSGAAEWSGVMGYEEPDPRAMVLEARAKHLGARLAAATRALLPGARIAAYMTALHTGWFPRGFLEGLAGGAPLQLFTFERDWRGAPYGFDVHHASALMLSKLRREEDAAIVGDILSRNHGVWLNRVSRADPPDPRAWHALEQTPLPLEARPALWDEIGRR